MARRGLTPSQWRSLPRDERVEMLAADRLDAEDRAALLAQIAAQLPTEAGALAQIMVMLDA